MKNLFGLLTKKDERKPVYWGYADKQGEKVKNWQQRFFVLFDNGDLEYYYRFNSSFPGQNNFVSQIFNEKKIGKFAQIWTFFETN